MFARLSSSRLLALSFLTSASLACTAIGAFPNRAFADALLLTEGAKSVDGFGNEVLGNTAQNAAQGTAQSTAETANYSDGKVSLDYPATWQVEVSEAGELGITNVPEVPSGLVSTRLYRVDAPPGPLVDANIDSFIEEGAAVSRYRSVTIDEQSALVIWLAERPGELSSAIATFIGYGDETIFLFSRYSPENAVAEENILNLHGSFVNLAEGAGVAPSEESSEASVTSEDTFSADEKPVLPTEELPLQNEEIQF
ncbi:MAG: hypothetical protein ACFB0D_18870 [Phormidesmis sp.]